MGSPALQWRLWVHPQGLSMPCCVRSISAALIQPAFLMDCAAQRQTTQMWGQGGFPAGCPSPAHPSTPLAQCWDPQGTPETLLTPLATQRRRLSALVKNSKCPNPHTSDQVEKCSSAPSSSLPSASGTRSKARSSLHDRNPSCGCRCFFVAATWDCSSSLHAWGM